MPQTSAIPSKYAAIVERLRREIKAGKYKDKIPSLRTLAADCGVNVKTAIKAVGVLNEEGLILKRHGTHVRRAPASTASVGLFLHTRGHLFENFFRALVGHLQEHDVLPTINDIGTPEFARHPERFLHRMSEGKPRALVIESGFQNVIPHFDTLLKKTESSIPRFVFAFAFEYLYEPPGSYILTDYFQGGRLLTKHLCGLGHEKILLVTFAFHKSYPEKIRPRSVSSSLISGFEHSLEEHDLAEGKYHLEFPVESWKPDFETRKAEYFKRFQTLMRREKPTAIIAASDYLAVQHLQVLGEMNLSVPRDVALTGYFNTPWAEATAVPLTSVSLQEETIARLVSEHCLRQDPAEDVREKIVVPPSLVIRASSGVPFKKSNRPGVPS